MYKDETLDAVRAVKVFDVLTPTQREGFKGNPDKFKIRCPLHTEKTPSFHAKANKWHCFGGCATGGDVIDLVQKLNGFDFKRAVEHIAKARNIVIAKRSRHDQHKLQEAYIALDHVQKTLRGNAFMADQYIRSRHLETEHIEQFDLGFCPGGLLTVIGSTSQKASTTILKELGLLQQENAAAPLTEPLAGRLTFAIRDPYNNIVGFAGRTLDPNRKPKYINTPDSVVFKKRNLLYGMTSYKADDDTGLMILVEGYFDVILARKHGLNNVVATMGTSFTPEQLKVALRANSRFGSGGTIAVCLDGDQVKAPSSYQAARLLVEHCATENANGVIVQLPEDLDPADILTNTGATGFLGLVEDTKINAIEFCAAWLCRNKYDMSDPDDQRKMMSELSPLIVKMNPFALDKVLAMVARAMGADIEQVRLAYEQVTQQEEQK